MVRRGIGHRPRLSKDETCHVAQRGGGYSCTAGESTQKRVRFGGARDVAVMAGTSGMAKRKANVVLTNEGGGLALEAPPVFVKTRERHG